MRARIPLTLVILTIVLSSCSLLPLPAGMQPARTSPAITRTPAPTRPLPSTATPTQPIPTATPAIPLSSTGPWLTYLSSSNVGAEVVVSNPDGSARKVIGALPDVFVPLFARPSTPGARYFSLQNGRDQSITIFQLPEGKAVKAYSLLSNKELSSDQRSLYGSILNQKSPASQVWSPDGQMLAFTAAMDGPYTDLYIFDTRDGNLRRLTERIGQSFYPVWSPDGLWVLVQEMDTQSSSTPSAHAVYAFSPDGVSMHYLYQPSSMNEQIFGWLDPDTFIVASRRQMGLLDARRFSMEKRVIAPLQFSGQMDQAVLDPAKGVLFFSVVPKDKDAPTLAAGLYWTSPVTGPVPVAKGKWQRLDWQPAAQRFFAFGTGGLLSYHVGGEKVIFEGEDNLPKASPDGAQLAFYSSESGTKPGLRLISPDGKQVLSVTEDSVQEVLWRPDSKGLFFISSSDLYYLPLPNGTPQKIETGVSNLGWVGAP